MRKGKKPNSQEIRGGVEGWEREGGGTDRLEDTPREGGGRKRRSREHNRHRWGEKLPRQRERAAQGHVRASQRPWGRAPGAPSSSPATGRLDRAVAAAGQGPCTGEPAGPVPVHRAPGTARPGGERRLRGGQACRAPLRVGEEQAPGAGRQLDEHALPSFVQLQNELN